MLFRNKFFVIAVLSFIGLSGWFFSVKLGDQEASFLNGNSSHVVVSLDRKSFRDMESALIQAGWERASEDAYRKQAASSAAPPSYRIERAQDNAACAGAFLLVRVSGESPLWTGIASSCAPSVEEVVRTLRDFERI